jgi:hypothetical protein
LVTHILAKPRIVQCLAGFWPEAIFADYSDQSSGNPRASAVLACFSARWLDIGRRWNYPALVINSSQRPQFGVY